MIMGPDNANKKSVAALIVSRMKPGGGAEDEAQEPADGLSEGERAAGEEALSAIKAGDVAGFVSAVKDLMDVMGPASEPEAEAPKSGFTD